MRYRRLTPFERRSLTPFERRMQRLRHRLAEYDLERLAGVSLIAVIIVWGVFIEIFKPVMP